MAGLNLTGAVQGYIGAREQRLAYDQRIEQQGFLNEQRERQRKLDAEEDAKRERTNAANAAGAAVIEKAKAGWDPKQGEFKPDPLTLISAFEARGHELARRGDIEGWVGNEAKAAPLRIQLRERAITESMQRFKVDGDAITLLQDTFPYLSGGARIKMARQVKGPDGKPMIEASTDDGKQSRLTVDELLQTIERAQQDPKMWAEMEMKLRFERQKAEIEAGKQKEVKTHEHGLKIEQMAAEGQQNEREIGLRTQGDLKVTGARTAGALRVAAEQGKNQVKAAEAKGAQDRLTQKEKPPTAGAKDKAITAVQLSELVRKNYGTITSGGFGSSRLGDAATAKITEGAQLYMRDNPDASELEAVNAAAEAYARRTGTKLGGSK